jgi:hypothetical protein
MPPDLKFLDPQTVMDAIDRKTFNPASRKSEVVGYYRRPNKGGMKNWIIWGDTQAGKRDDYIYRGFTPLPQMGRVGSNFTGRDAQLFAEYGGWGAILSRPGGPELFPLDQIITFRWYLPENVGSPAQGYQPMTHVRFPQLAQAVKEGLKISEYGCPDCESVTYLQPVHLARHLRNSHDWDRADILAWGKAQDIDFSKEFRPRLVTYDYDVTPVVEPEAVEAPPFVERVQTPTLAQAQAVVKKACIMCAKAKAGVCKRHVVAA